MNENKITLKKTELITNITANIIDEIESNTDYKENRKDNITYFSVNTSLFSDNDFLDKVEKYGLHYLSFYLYLKTQMLTSGSYYFYERNLKRIVKNYCLNFGGEINDIYIIYNDLISTKKIFVIDDSIYFDEPIVTDPYIVYNYLLTNNKRVYNRLMQRESRKKKQEKLIDSEGASAPSAPVPTVSADDIPLNSDDDDFNIF